MAASYGYPTERKEFIAQTDCSNRTAGRVVGRTALEKQDQSMSLMLWPTLNTLRQAQPNLRPSRTVARRSPDA